MSSVYSHPLWGVLSHYHPPYFEAQYAHYDARQMSHIL